MAGTINKPKKPKSKRTTVRLRNKIEKRSAAKQRKTRKLANKNPQWKSKVKKDPGIPNSLPFKDQILQEIEEARLLKQEEAQKRREAAKAAKTGLVAGDGEEDIAMADEVDSDEDDSEDGDDDDDDADADAMDEDNDQETAAADANNPLAALLSSARAAAEQYQKQLETDGGDSESEPESDSDSDQEQARGPSIGQAHSRKAYDKVFKKVVEQADVVLYVLDARDPEGTRSKEVERAVVEAAGEKRLILILNKIDLIPTTVLRGWLAHLRRFFPTLPVRAAGGSAPAGSTFTHGADLTPQRTSATLFQALKTYASKRDLKRAVTVGVVGYPNVGKSSIINTLLGRLAGKSKGGRAATKACPAGAEAGVTKSIRSVKIDGKLTLLDSPGIIFPSSSNGPKSAVQIHAQHVLLNAVPPKQIDDPIPAVTLLLRRLSRSPELMQRLLQTYGLPPLVTAPNGDMTNDFLVQVARKRGRLGKGGVPNLNAAAMTVVTDWRDGRIQGWAEPPAQPLLQAQIVDGTAVIDSKVEGAGPDHKLIVTEWAKEFDLDGLWGGSGEAEE